MDAVALNQYLAPHPCRPRSNGCGAALRELTVYVGNNTLSSDVFTDLLLHAPNSVILEVLIAKPELAQEHKLGEQEAPDLPTN